MIIRGKAQHSIITESVPRCDAVKPAAVKPIEAAIQSPDPKPSRLIDDYRSSRITRQSFIGCVRRHIAICKLVQTVFCSRPQRALTIEIERLHKTMRKTIPRPVNTDVTVLIAADSVVRANPKGACCVKCK